MKIIDFLAIFKCIISNICNIFDIILTYLYLFRAAIYIYIYKGSMDVKG